MQYAEPNSQMAMVSQSRLPDMKLLVQIVLKICSILCQKLQGSRDTGHALLQGKLFVRPLGITDTKLCTKFEVSSSSGYVDIDAAIVDITLNDL